MSRLDLRTAFTQSLLGFQSANTGLLEDAGMVSSARPAALTDRRTVFVGAIREPLISLDSGTFGRDAEVDVWCCVPLGENTEATDHADELGDAVVDWFAANARAHIAGAGYVLLSLRSDSAEVSEGGTFVPAVVVTCSVSYLTGRS